AIVAQVAVVDAYGRPALRTLAQVREGRIPARQEVLDRDRMPLADAIGERRFGPHDVVMAARVRGGNSADVILAGGHVQRRLVAEDQAQAGERLGRNTVVVVALAAPS